jgi:hypothetical protein
MRKAVQEQYKAITGHEPDFCFSGWAGELTEGERAVVENRPPAAPSPTLREKLEELAKNLKLRARNRQHIGDSDYRAGLDQAADELLTTLGGKS